MSKELRKEQALEYHGGGQTWKDRSSANQRSQNSARPFNGLQPGRSRAMQRNCTKPGRCL